MHLQPQVILESTVQAQITMEAHQLITIRISTDRIISLIKVRLLHRLMGQERTPITEDRTIVGLIDLIIAEAQIEAVIQEAHIAEIEAQALLAQALGARVDQVVRLDRQEEIQEGDSHEA